jgi:hypothetical protein
LDIRTLELVSSSTRSFDINRIFDPNAVENNWSRTPHNIFGAMPHIASAIAEPFRTRMSQLAEQRIREQEERERQQREQEESRRLVEVQRENTRFIIGRWESTAAWNYLSGGSIVLRCILEFREDGSINVIQYETGEAVLGYRRFWDTRQSYLYSDIIRGSGTGRYSLEGDRITVQLNLNNTIQNSMRQFSFTSTILWQDTFKNEFGLGQGNGFLAVTGTNTRYYGSTSAGWWGTPFRRIR